VKILHGTKKKEKKVSNMRFDKKALMQGINVELEHARTAKRFARKGVSVRRLAASIAQDHLRENKNYYKKLKKARL
jgi:hypothetical protein